MVHYKKYRLTDENHPLKGLRYTRPVIEEAFDTGMLAKYMTNHNTPYSAGLIGKVLTDMIAYTKELILDSKDAKLDGLAILSVGTTGKKGAASVAELTLANSVEGLKLHTRVTDELSNAQINLGSQLKEALKYSADSSSENGGSTPGGDDEEEEDSLG